MKILFFTFMLFLIPVSFAQEIIIAEKQVVCGNIDSIVSELTGKEYREYPMWVGSTALSNIVLYVNTSTATWTLVEHNDEIGCIIGVGKNFYKGGIKYDA